MAIAVKEAGSFEGQRVDEAVLTSNTGVNVTIMNWGVTVRDWQVPVQGESRSVLLGFDSFDPYPDSPYFGALVGRVANRIRGARFTLDGQTYDLTPNEGPNQLHGGPGGLSSRIWDMAPDTTANAVRFTHTSPDGAMGYPGTVDFEVTYTLKGNRLLLDMRGIPDRPTPISLVQHHYFNLGATDTVLDHTVHMPYCVARTDCDDDLLMNGKVLPTVDTQYDFTSPRTLRAPDGTPVDYDLNMVLATRWDASQPVVIASGEDSALTLKLWTDQPGIQFYNSVTTNVEAPGHGGRRYGRYAGLCFEDQMFPDAVNQPHFPAIICTPDAPYAHHCEIEIA
mgnify:CR=1 FL=1